MAPLSISANDSLNDAMDETAGLDFGATDCALPMLDALEKKIPVDVFVILTDSETWAGPVHPTEALRKYRQEMDIPAKLVVVRNGLQRIHHRGPRGRRHDGRGGLRLGSAGADRRLRHERGRGLGHRGARGCPG